MKILIDNGHGQETAGKRSPDGRLLEWSYNREIARRVVATLQSEHFYASLLVPEDEDISLAERCKRVNRVCFELGRRSLSTVSILSTVSQVSTLSTMSTGCGHEKAPPGRMKKNGCLQPGASVDVTTEVVYVFSVAGIYCNLAINSDTVTSGYCYSSRIGAVP